VTLWPESCAARLRLGKVVPSKLNFATTLV
jgi:hypothetical protein